MSVQVFIAAHARDGLAQVRRALGDDAVVLATRPHPQGVEILASAYGDLRGADSSSGDSSMAAPDSASATPGSSRILSELARLRELLQNQLAGFAWSQTRRRDPVRVALLQTLFAAGFGSALARTLAARAPRGMAQPAAQRWLRQVLIRNLPVHASNLIQGGRYALAGPTGAGKTTTLAKLAARGVALHGASQVVLVAADTYRIGATAQLSAYASLLGVSLLEVQDTAELAKLLPTLNDTKLVLIDTAGSAPADPRVRDLHVLDTLGVQRIAVISASQQGAAIEQAMCVYSTGSVACILTKLDETPQPGAALDSLIRHRVPLAHVSSGQRVPEDLHVPNAAYLVDRALKGGQLDTPYALQDQDWPLFAGVEAGRSARDNHAA